MATQSVFDALILGVLEGLTEFIPVSSTGHILLAGHFLGFESTGKTFEVVIQLGAVLAILLVYAGRLWEVARAIPADPNARRFVLSVLVAFIPAVIVGVLAHDVIKNVLFETPVLIAVMLILGGFVLLGRDNVVAPGARGFEALGVTPAPMEAVLEGYLYVYRPGGQYSAIKDSATQLRA